MKNEKALDAYIATIAEINAKLAALTEQTENHMGYSPEEINWGHVGTAKHAGRSPTRPDDGRATERSSSR